LSRSSAREFFPGDLSKDEKLQWAALEEDQATNQEATNQEAAHPNTEGQNLEARGAAG